MALLFVDGFSHYATANLPLKYPVSPNCAAPYGTIVDTFPRRTGGKSFAPTGAAFNGGLHRALGSLKQTLAVGIAFRASALGSNYPLIQLSSGGTAQCCLCIEANGSVTVRRPDGSGTILGQSSPALITSGVWYYLEFKALVENAGSYEAWLNGTSILSGSGDTQNASGSGADIVHVFSPFSGNGDRLTDLYIDDSANHGDCRIETIMPSAAGSHAQFTPSAGENYANVDDPDSIDDDTSYNASNTAGQHDSFAMQDISLITGSVIKGVQLSLTMRKDDAGNRTVTPIFVADDVDYPNADPVIVADEYRLWRWIYEEHPDTTAWTRDNVNAIEAGYKLVS